MPGRLTVTFPPEELALRLGLDPAALVGLTPRYNAAPGQLLPVIRLDPEGQAEVVPLRWGLVPTWAKAGTSVAAGLVNARSETVAEKPSFREAGRLRRCLILTDGFIEWETVAGRKQPHWFRLDGGAPFGFAGLWEPPAEAVANPEGTVAVLTTEPNPDVKPFHDRMPGMFRPEQFKAWLTAPDWATAYAMLTPWPAGSLTHQPVSRELNSPKVERADLLRPVAASLFD